MVSVGDFFYTCWRYTGRPIVYNVKQWHAARIMSTYQKYHKAPVANDLPPRTRRLSISDESSLAQQHVAVQADCRLLNLPTEIRALIWKHVFSDHDIALFREGNKITHCLLDDSNCHGFSNAVPVKLETLAKVIFHQGLSTPRRLQVGRRKQPRAAKLQVVPLLQTCRTIYTECINTLYSTNTFTFLQNDTLPDFISTTLPGRLQFIKSIHFHFSFRELEPWKARWGFNEVNLWNISKALLPPHFPALENLSIFIQGPIWLGATYQSILAHLTSIATRREESLKFFAVRLPRQMSDPVFGSIWGLDIDEMVEDASWPFQIIRPDLYSAGDGKDTDVGLDVGWRFGSMLVPRGNGESEKGFELKNYTVWTPMPPGLSWPCHRGRN